MLEKLWAYFPDNNRSPTLSLAFCAELNVSVLKQNQFYSRKIKGGAVVTTVASQ